MPPIFRISRDESGFDAVTIDEPREILRDAAMGRDRVVEIRADPLTSGHTSRAWGHLIREFEGSVAEEPRPWPE
jgi:hypothetical protein